MLYILCGALAVGGIITVISSVATLIIALFDKDKKEAVKGPIIAFAAGILVLFLLFFVGRLF